MLPKGGMLMYITLTDLFQHDLVLFAAITAIFMVIEYINKKK